MMAGDQKLRYVERVARRVRELDPVMPTGNIDLGVEDMKVTVEQFYRRLARQNGAAVKVAMESDFERHVPATRPATRRTSARRGRWSRSIGWR